MFGKFLKSNLIVSLLLLGICIYILKLHFQGNINLYIHPRYDNFSVVMCTLAIIMLLAGIIIELKKRYIAKHPSFKIHFLDVIVVSVLGLAFLLPPQALSSKAIDRKSLNTPSYDTTLDIAAPIDTDCPDTKPDSIEMWVYEISQYPARCYEGQTIELTGFVIEHPSESLPDDMYYLGRVVISCCIIDARPYALPIKTGSFGKHPIETWLKVSGNLQLTDVNGSNQLAIEPKNVHKIDNPSKPYDYINIPSYQPAVTREPLP